MQCKFHLINYLITGKTICVVTTSNAFKYCYKVVFQFQSFLVIDVCKIMHKQATLINAHYIKYLSFQLLPNHGNPSTYKLLVLVKPELSMHGPMGHQNISFVSQPIFSKIRKIYRTIICNGK